MKRSLLRILTSPRVAPVFEWLTRDSAVIFMLHRFQDPERGTRGIDPTELGCALSELRRRGYEFLDLREMVKRLLEDGGRLQRSIAFTMDDGYADQAFVGAPVFAAYDCPVTIFVTSGFLDRDVWMWWDKIAYVFGRTSRTHLRFETAGAQLQFSLGSSGERDRARHSLVQRCVAMADAERITTLEALARSADVELPLHPPREFEAMTWDEARRCEGSGAQFAPHTVTHPILAAMSSDASRFEIEQSWKRVREETRDPLAVFAYPNGLLSDFGPRETETLKGLGFVAAFTAVNGYNAARWVRGDEDRRFQLRRWGFPDGLEALRYAIGVGRMTRQSGWAGAGRPA